MTQKSIYAPRVVVASQQGSVIHIKSKQSGKVLLKLKLVCADGEDELLLDCAVTVQAITGQTALLGK